MTPKEILCQEFYFATEMPYTTIEAMVDDVVAKMAPGGELLIELTDDQAHELRHELHGQLTEWLIILNGADVEGSEGF